ncbi:hypothetical protein [Geobacter sp. DSM 9736]|uniref:hypothetical protein n=1 Tax=Geobacter sp. DSM 9736 TaxID=1277350 RepID=UPI000B51458E|nr:hypothetical protein [Geobacter sp. DSM 9736]SNB48080.1 hypothetical protein SAMN06269301_3576 [Geobacter sp. DSM 9736]
MKGTMLLLNTLLLWLLTITPAFAASTTKVYNSGILVLVFLGFCALVVVAQLIPALITLWGMIKSVVTAEGKSEAAKAETGK